jgi:thiol-disulfide isomerase/thioredoxin
MKFKTLFTIALATLLFACTNTNTQQVTISGTITNPKGDTVKIMMKDTSYITTLNEAAHFNISFNLDSATYLSFFHGNESTAMFLKGGENVNLTIDTEFFDETIIYEGSAESSYLAKKYLLEEEINIYEQLVTTEKEVFTLTLNKYIAKLTQELSSVNNEEFVAAEKEKNVKNAEFYTRKSEDIANLPKIGEPAIDFTYPDKEGNELSLSTFKGSLVYVDVWATWCGPCVGEIPALKELEHDYHNNNITFLSVSVDTDKEAWLTMVAEKQLGGVQLWANGWTEITKSYAIISIPRFMLFDADGNIISLNAPIPSSDEIRGLLDANLGGLPNL